MTLFGSHAAVSIGGRLLVAACLLLALAAPHLPGSRVAMNVTVLVDDSRSMPRDFIDGAWRTVAQMYAALPAPDEPRLLRFAADVVPESPGLLARSAAAASPVATLPRSAAIDGSATNIHKALQAALYQLPVNRPSALLLISDGAATHGDTGSALQQLRRAGVPVYLWAPPGVNDAGAPRLLDVQAPSSINLGDHISLLAQLRGTPDSKLELSLLADGVLRERRRLTLPAAGSTTAAFHITPPQPGVVELTIRIEGDPGVPPHPAMQLTRAVSVQGQAPVLYLAARQKKGPVLDRLRGAGLNVTALAPEQLASRRAVLEQVGAIILDDVAIADMSEGDWEALSEAVQEQGSGLLVLGGANSFGAGAYRHSRLERLLPVTAEAAQPQEQAAVLFLLDKSGSMGRQQEGPSRFALGRQAVAAAAQQLLPGDLLGITAFAEEVDIRLPLAPGGSIVADMVQALQLGPGGGTRLAPALRSAAQQLRRVDVAQRLLVLVTDGFASEEDLRPMAAILEAEGVTVIALAVGSETNLATLGQLTRFNGGRILPVTKVASLPRLMSAEVATQRAPRAARPTAVVPLRQPPFLSPGAVPWPPLAGYMVSKLRESADLYLQSDNGDPLLATGFAGAGRVAVLPGGLGSWATSWWNWPHVDEFLGGILRWLGRGTGASNLWLMLEEQDGHLLFTVDQRVAGAWSTQPPRLMLREPTGALIELPMD